MIVIEFLDGPAAGKTMVIPADFPPAVLPVGVAHKIDWSTMALTESALEKFVYVPAAQIDKDGPAERWAYIPKESE